MKHNIIYAIYGIAFICGIFGMQAVAEADLSLGASAAILAGIIAVMTAGARHVNNLAETEE